MLRKLALSLAVSAAFAATQANALGLGDIRVKSALNEPLNAEIQLNQVRDLNPLQIKPRMASEDDFALAGLGQSRALSDIRFQVRVNPNGSGVIQMTSREPIREPFMNFLVEVNWPSGRLVREYTVLLDPPVFDPTPTQQVIQPAAAVAPVQSAPAVRSTATAAKAPVSNIRTRADKKTQTYVDVKDTLWEIAIRHRAAPDISSYQMMVALQKKNPHAFPDGNINNLKAGVVMNLPTEAEARAITSTQAAAEVRRQTTLWKQGRSSGSDKAPVDGSKSDVKRDAAESKPSEQEDNGQLKVVAPKDEAKKDEAATSDTTTEAAKPEPDEKEQLVAKNEELENRLAISQESMDRLERDNADLNEKLDAIQQQLDSLQRLIELKDQQLAALQDELRAKEAPPAPVAPPPEKSLLDKIMQTPEYLAGIGGGLIAVLLGVWALMRRKKKQQEAVEEEEFMASAAAPAAAAAATAAVVADEADEADLEALETAAEELSSAADSDEISEEDLAALDDLDDLNLDMDLDLDGDIESDLENMALESEQAETTVDNDDDDLLDSILNEQDDEAAVAAVDDDEFDLGLDDFAELDEAAVELPEDAEEEVDLALSELESELDDVVSDNGMDDLDELLAMDDDEPSAEEIVQQRAQRNGMGSVDAVSDIAETDDTLESLGLDGLAGEDELEEPASDAAKTETTAETADDADDLDLDFDLDDISLPEETPVSEVADVAEDAEDFESDLMADLDDILAAEDSVDEKPETLASDDDLDFELADDATETVESADTADVVAEAELPEIELDDIDAMLADIDEMPEDVSVEPEAEIVEEKPEKKSDFTSSADLHPEIAELLDDPVSLDEELPMAELDETELDLAGIELDEDAPLPNTPTDEEVTEELTANIEHDLDAELDDELDSLLNSTDTDIALEETMSDEEDPLDALGLLDGADEVETKLDLARAYIDMDDIDGARDILNEIADEGNDAQKAEAKELLEGLA